MSEFRQAQLPWKEYRLSDILNLISGGTPKTTVPEYWNGDIPWLSVSDFSNGRKYTHKAEKSITNFGLKKSSTNILKEGQLIISARGTVGVISMLGKDMAFNQSNSYGAVFNTITKNTFDHIKVKLPPLPEQRAIAEVLSSLDDKIDLLHRQSKTLEQMAETLFKQWFVPFDSAQGTNKTKEDWGEGILPDEFDFLMGQSPKGSSFNEEGTGIPMYQGNADFDFRFPNRRVYTTEAKRLAQKYETLISVRAPVGEQNMALEECCIGRGVAAFKYKANPEYYTYTYFKMRSLMDEIKQFNNEGTVFGSISKSDFQALSISKPPQNLVDKFQNEAKPIDDKAIENSIQIRTLEKMRDTLLPKLMSGEIRVKYEDAI